MTEHTPQSVEQRDLVSLCITITISYFFTFLVLQYIILVVDSTDRERMSISSEELHKMLGHEELSKANILVFANKQVRHFPKLF